MPRQLSNWLDAYMQYTEHTESARQFHKWTALSCIASALQRKTWLEFGMFKTFPNIFVVLTAEPGRARKTQALRVGQSLMKDITQINLAPDSITAQRLYVDLEEAYVEEPMPVGEILPHCSLTISSDEFESFLGQQGENQVMITALTNLYDCKEGEFQHKTKHSGASKVMNPWLNLIAGTTPDSLAVSFPYAAIGGGLSSRITFIWAWDRAKSVAIPEAGGDPDLKQNLIRDLAAINRIAGPMPFSDSGRKWWVDWYNSYDMGNPARLCTNTKFLPWYSRKPTLVQKVAQLVAAAKRDYKDITEDDFIAALKEVEEVEIEMEQAFQGVGQSETAPQVKTVEDIIREHKSISEDALLQRCWRDMDIHVFDQVTEILKRRGVVRRAYRQAGERVQVFYDWQGV